MELTVNTAKAGAASAAGNAAQVAETGSVEHKAEMQSPKVLVTDCAVPAPGDDFATQAATIPPETFSRDDALGKLVSAAFNLPAPPMPEFK